jgi:excisionase family DNA binding protein
MEHFLSPKELAAAISVSESSLKRWVDDGTITATRTAGGHRRIAVSEAVRFIRKEKIPLSRPELLGIPGMSKRPAMTPADTDGLLMRAIREGRGPEVRSLLFSSYLSGRSVGDLCDGPLAGALHAVGEFWKHGPEGIAIEHRAVDLCVQALQALRSILPPAEPYAAVAMGGAPEGDPYVLPSLMVTVVLATAGWNAINLGADLPARALLAAAGEQKPALVWLSCSVEQAAREQERELRKAAETLISAGAQVIIGGRAWAARGPDLPPGVKFMSSMGAVAAFAEGLSTARRSRRS